MSSDGDVVVPALCAGIEAPLPSYTECEDWIKYSDDGTPRCDHGSCKLSGKYDGLGRWQVRSHIIFETQIFTISLQNWTIIEIRYS